MKKSQTIIAVVILVLMGVLAQNLDTSTTNLPLFLITGLMLGYTLTRSRYGFAGGIRKIYFTGDGALTKALLLMFALSALGTAGIHFGAAQKGAVAAFKAAEGQMIIPGTGHVQIASLATIIGGILFGVGMIFGGGCASGTLTDTGEGEIKGLIVTFFFGLGGMLGIAHSNWWSESVFTKVGKTIYLPDVLGYIGTITLTLGLLGILYIITIKYEEKRKREGTFVKDEFEEWQKPIKADGKFKLFSSTTYHNLFVARWPFMTGAFIMSVLFVFIINSSGSSWGASGPYALWSMWLLDKIGIDSWTNPALVKTLEAVRNGLLKDPVTVRNLGIIFGSSISMLLAGKFRFNFHFNFKDVIFYAIGGLLMGYGSRVARGCNVGALYSGISNFSLSGWVFLVAITLGGIIGSSLYKRAFSK